VDFSDQEAVFQDLQNKYGHENVARIVAFGKMTPKAVIRKVLNSFEVPGYEIKKITDLVPDLCKSLEDAYKASPELLKLKAKFKAEWDVIERLENVISHESMHAGGVVIYPNLSDFIPIKKTSKSNGMLVAGWDKYMLEELGFYKFDILGLETLPVLRGALDSIRHTTGKDIDLNTIDYEDPAVYDMLCKGDVSGIFQLNNQATKVIEQQPRNFRDLIAINALIRPGVGDWEEYIARRRGKEWTIYEPRMPYMKETEGTMTYQEQFLLDAYHIAGWDIAYADKHIRKNGSIRTDEGLRTKFIEDSIARGHEEEEVLKVWSDIEDAVDGGYSFNKSHSASYARISYQTAYLKTHYPEHFYASLMTGEKTDGDGQDAIAGYVAECKQRGITIDPPDINHSGDTFVVANGNIKYRITTIRHVGDSAINHIQELRPIASFDDFLERKEKKYAKKNVIINLIKAGAFDFDNPDRAELMWKFDMSERTKTQIKEEFVCERAEWNDKIKAEWEMDVLGMYLSVHPMERYGFQSLETYQEGQQALQGGEVVRIFDFHPKKDPSNPKMAFVTINTLFGHVKLVVFASYWKRRDFQEAFTEGNLVLVKGKKQGNDVLVDQVEVL
jgi:DNA polymerase III subunit alpha